MSGRDEVDVSFDTACLDAPLVVLPRAAVPGALRAPDRADIELLAHSDDPDRYRLAQCSVRATRGDLELRRGRYRGKFISIPYGHISAPWRWSLRQSVRPPTGRREVRRRCRRP